MGRVVLAMLALALVASAFPLAAGELPPGGMFGGDLRFALQSAADLNPIAFPANRLVQQLAYDGLTRLGPDQKPAAWLAASWAGAGAVLTVELRAGATWPDGTAIRAQDVAWSYGKHLAAGTVAGFAVSAVDADTLTVTFTSGGGDFLGNAGTFPVAWKDGSNTVTPNGPYVVESQGASSVVLAANPQHWRGRPYLDRVAFQFPYTLVRNPDESTRADDAACALLFRDVHVIGWPVTQTDLTSDRDCVASHGGFSDGLNRTLLNPDPARTAPHIGIAENPGLSYLYLGMNTQRAPLTDPLLRVALTRAIDRDLIAGTFGGAIEPKTDIADSPITSANPAWFNDSVPQYRVPRIVSGGQVVPDLGPVNAFLDAAGYVDRDGDGYRDDPSGTPFSFTILTFDGTADPRVAKYLDLVTKFRGIGIDVAQREMTPADLRATVASDAFDLFVDVQTVRGEPSFLFDLLHSTGRDNVVNLASPVLDGMLERARDALDPAVRRQAVFDAQGWISEFVPIAPIVHYRSLHAHDREAFAGWANGLGGIVSFWTFVGAHVTQRGPLTVRVDALQPSVRANATTTILVQVRDAQDNPVEFVSLELTGEGLAETSGLTDAEGQFEATFTAPAAGSTREIAIDVQVAKAGYEGAGGRTTVTVHPIARSLLLSLVKGTAAMPSGNATFIRVGVIDASTASPVANAPVRLSVSPGDVGERLGASAGTTDAQGFFETTFTANVTVLTRFLVVADVDLPGFESARITTSLEVTPRPQAPQTPGLDTLTMVAAVAALAALFGVWQRRKWVERKP